MKTRGGMHARLTMAALTRRPGMVALAVVAVAIGASVAAALLHVSSDVTRKLTSELRVLGPNLVILPDETRSEYIDERDAMARLSQQSGVVAVPLLHAVAKAGDVPVRVVGAGPDPRLLHPSWRSGGGKRPTSMDLRMGTISDTAWMDNGMNPGRHGWIGTRLAKRLGVMTMDSLELSFPQTGNRARIHIEWTLESGGPEDEAVFLPLPDAQSLTGHMGRISAIEMRVEGDASRAEQIATALEQGGGVRARVRYALTRTEGDLLERMRRLMALVTIAALVSAGLCAFGTLTDLALERRKEIALLKALGATPLEIVRQFGFESLAIGLVGGLAGWLIGAFFAQVIGRTVFESAIALRLDVPLLVLGLATLVAVAAGLGPIRLALGVDPARVLKGD